MIFLALVALLTLLAYLVGVTMWLPHRPLSERLLVTALLCALSIQLEVLSLSQLPVEAPLRTVPTLHLLGLAMGMAALVSQKGWAEVKRCTLNLAPRPLELFRDLGRVGTIVLLGTVLTLGGVLAWGVITGPHSVDELAYHYPQAAHIYQDQEVGRPENYLPWTYAYPQGAAMIWGWSMLLSGGDRAIHAVQLAFGVQLLLAVYVLSRRSGAARLPAMLAVLLLATAPVFFRMTTIATADICFAAGILTMVAFTAPRKMGDHRVDYRLAVLGFAQAASTKIPILAVLVAAALLVFVLVQHRSWREPRRIVRGFRALPDALILIVVGASLTTYAVNLWRYGNPFWPLRITVGERAFLPGPLATFTDHTIGAHSTWGTAATMSRAELWLASFLDWSQPLNEDSLGSFGPGIALVALPLFALAAFGAIRRRDAWLLTLSLVCSVAIIAVPVLFIPRYGLPIVAAVVAVAAVGAHTSYALRPPVVAVVVAVAAFSAAPSLHLVGAATRWYEANATQAPWFVDGGRSVPENHWLGPPNAVQSPDTVSYIRRQVLAGDVVAWNIQSYPTLMWNLDYSNEIRFVSGSTRERYPTGPSPELQPNRSELKSWVRKIRLLQPDHVVVYRDSAYCGALLASHGWRVAFQDPGDAEAAVAILVSDNTT